MNEALDLGWWKKVDVVVVVKRRGRRKNKTPTNKVESAKMTKKDVDRILFLCLPRQTSLASFDNARRVFPFHLTVMNCRSTIIIIIITAASKCFLATLYQSTMYIIVLYRVRQS